MAVIKLKPTSPGQRFKVKVVTEGLHKGSPHKGLLKKKKRTSGRNNAGRITVEGRGGGHKRHLRVIDFKRNKDGIPARVERIEYDPNRSAHLALLVYADGERRYIVATKNMKAGDKLLSGADAPIAEGNCLPFTSIPVGSLVSCIEMKPGKGAQLIRSAGGFAQILARDAGYVTLRLPSKEVRKVLATCRAVVGEVCNGEHNLKVYGSAGAKRRLGIRPNVRGVAKNPVDHPLGGGEGRTSGGRPACNKNGLIDGKKTRSRKKNSTRFIVRSRSDKRK